MPPSGLGSDEVAERDRRQTEEDDRTAQKTVARRKLSLLELAQALGHMSRARKVMLPGLPVSSGGVRRVCSAPAF